MKLVSSNVRAHGAKLTILDEDRRIGNYALSEGATLMIGSGGNCGIRLNDQTISSIHCVLRLEDGQLVVQDWCSTLGTTVNDERVEEEKSVPNRGLIQVGRFRVLVELVERLESIDNNVLSATPKSSANVVVKDDDSLELESASDDVGAMFETAEVAPDVTASQTGEASAFAVSEDERCESELESGDARKARREDRQRSVSALRAGVDPETINLLQAEVECLQSELLERDRQLAELQELVGDSPPAPLDVDSGDSDILLGRLEQLLEELQGSDERIRVLEELLQMEQDVTRAQQEERVQIEAWLQDIERRMAAREEEWQAERDALLTRVARLKDERDEADRRIEDVEKNPHGAALQQNVLQELRGHVDLLQEKLDHAERQCHRLEAELLEAKTKSPEQVQREFLEEALREDRLKLAQEQAAVSRERSELARRMVEVEGIAKREQPHEADQRFRAFRETLKELHNKDQQGESTVRKASLGTRIADLWRRLEGPTDTD